MRLQDARKKNSVQKRTEPDMEHGNPLSEAFCLPLKERSCEKAKIKVTEDDETNDCLARKEDGCVLSLVVTDNGGRAG